jgi:hypothetical protein
VKGEKKDVSIAHGDRLPQGRQEEFPLGPTEAVWCRWFGAYDLTQERGLVVGRDVPSRRIDDGHLMTPLTECRDYLPGRCYGDVALR